MAGRYTCFCGAEMKVHKVNHEYKNVVITDVPVLLCPECGEVFYRATTIKAMEKLVEANPKVESIKFRYVV